MLARKEDEEATCERTELAGASRDMPAARFSERRVSKHPLHGFSFPTMSWGSHRIFRCVNSDAETGPSDAVLMGMESPRYGKTGGSSEKEAMTADWPWNLRKRRAACFDPGENGGRRNPSISDSCWRFGRDDRRRKFSVALSREEIEGDFYVFKGMKPRRRPQKRAGIVQRKLDELFPGLWLEEVTLDSYKVDERVKDESKKVA